MQRIHNFSVLVEAHRVTDLKLELGQNHLEVLDEGVGVGDGASAGDDVEVGVVLVE